MIYAQLTFFLPPPPSPIWNTLGYLCIRCVPYANPNQQVLTKLIKVKTSRLNFVSHNENRSAGVNFHQGVYFTQLYIRDVLRWRVKRYTDMKMNMNRRNYIITTGIKLLWQLSRSFLFPILFIQRVFFFSRSRSERREDVTIGMYSVFSENMDAISLKKYSL